MALNAHTTSNTTSSSANPTYLNKQYYDKRLLEFARTKFKHAQFGQKRNIPKNNGKTVEYRKWEVFTPSTTPLSEAVVPDGQAMTQSHVEATVAQYGAFVTVSDMLELTAYDPILRDAVKLLGEQMGTTLDWITRDAMCAGTNVQYADGATTRRALTASKKLTTTEIRKAVRTLKKAKAPMFSRGGREHYICICSPDSVYDLQSDQLWQDVSKYSNAEQIYSGEIGRIFGVVFVESTEAKVYTSVVNNAVNAATSSSTDFVLRDTPTAEEVAYLSTGGNKIYVGSTEYTLASSGSYTEATQTVKLSAAASLTKDAAVHTGTAGADGVDVHASLVFGQDAYGCIEIGSGGAIESIIKEKGSGGTSDPLNQFSTVGAKINAYCAKILQPLWLLRIEHGVSA